MQIFVAILALALIGVPAVILGGIIYGMFRE